MLLVIIRPHTDLSVYLEGEDGDAEVERQRIDGGDGGTVTDCRQVSETVEQCERQTDDRQHIGEH